MGKGWKNTHKQAAAQKKGQAFTKLAREIAVSAKMGGPDPEGNARLKLAITAARAASCPKDTIERAIKKGSGQLDDGSVIEEMTYEGYGPHGIGVLVECQTDNKNRAVSEVRTVFKKHNGNMGETGSVAWMFERVSLIEGTKAGVEDPEEDAIEAGASEVEPGENEGSVAFYGAVNDLDTIRSVLTERGWEITVAELSYKATNITELNDDQKNEAADFLSALEDLDDSHRVYATLA